MALLDDVVSLTLLASAAFFVALSLGLLVRYRQASQKISSSTDLGHDLWNALEQRMRKQDERILDMMGRMEVLQSRIMAPTVVHEPHQMAPLPPLVPAPAQPEANIEQSPPLMQQPVVTESQVTPPESQESPPQSQEVLLDETQLAAIKFLGDGSKSTRELTNAMKKSREYTARVMKELFDMGLVRRNDSTKPFVYQLTDVGRRYLSHSTP